MKLCLNLSMHPLHKKCVEDLHNNGIEKVIDVPLEAVKEFNSETIVNTLLKTLKKLYKKFKKFIEVGDFCIVLPGHSALASIVLVFFHATSGFFPSIVTLERDTENVFRFKDLIKLQDFRDKWRQDFR